jgi:metal-sulfur cluster biosynthetic enzyme
MTLTAPGCGMGPVLLGDVEYRVGKVPNVRSVRVELVFDPPWSRERMSEEAQLETGMYY